MSGMDREYFLWAKNAVIEVRLLWGGMEGRSGSLFPIQFIAQII